MKFLSRILLALTMAWAMSAQALVVVNQFHDAADADPGDGVCDADLGQPGPQCTLRAAVMHAANQETIRLPPGRYTLSIPRNAALPNAAVGDLFIDGRSLTIESLGFDRAEIVAAPELLDGLFWVRTGNLTLRNLVLEGSGMRINNRSGGAIYCGIGGGMPASTVTLENVRMHGFHVEYNGGAISAWETCHFSLSRVEVHDNRADANGGGIHFSTGSGRDFVFDQISVWNNSAGNHGGGIYRGNYLNHLQLSNATLTGNRAQYGAAMYIFQVGRTGMRNVTIAGNGGPNHFGWNAEYAVEAQGLVAANDGVANSIIAGNHAVAVGDMAFMGTLTSSGHNLFGSYDSTIGVITVQGSDRHGIVDPQLHALAIPDGSLTGLPVMIPMPNSLAVNAGNTQAPNDAMFERCRVFDASGHSRAEGECDIGAVEAVVASSDDPIFASGFDD